VEKHAWVRSLIIMKVSANAENEAAISSIILGNSLLTANGVPVPGEYEIKNAQADEDHGQFWCRRIVYETYAMDFSDDVVLMGHDGPGHLASPKARQKCGP